MEITFMYSEIMSTITPFLILGGILGLTISLISMLIQMITNAATGKGFTIGLK